MSAEYRRAKRRQVSEAIQVMDTMTDTLVGRLSDLSETGLQLIASVPLVDDALYQLRFKLSGIEDRSAVIEAGVHLLWQDTASAPGQTWTGFRFIHLPDHQLQQLRRWLDKPHGTFE